MGISYSFDHGISILFVYGDDGFDEIGPKMREYFKDSRWHYGETQMLVSTMGRKFNVFTWEEIQSLVDVCAEKIKPPRVALHYDTEILLEPLMIAHAQFSSHKIPCRLFTEFGKAMDWLLESPEHITGLYRFEGDVLWITLRDCKTLDEALQPFERAMKHPKFKPGLKVAWDLTLQKTVLTQKENSRGIEWLVENGLGKTAMLISNRINRQDIEVARKEYLRLGAEAQVFTDVTEMDKWLEIN